MDQKHDTVLAVAFCADAIALHGFVIVHSLQVNADRGVPSHPSAKGNRAANVAGEWWPSVCNRAPTTSGASSQQVASGNVGDDLGKSTDAQQLHVNGGHFGSPQPLTNDSRSQWRERNEKWDFSSGEDDDDGKLRASIAGASKSVDGKFDITRANTKTGRYESAQGKKHLNLVGVPADLKMDELCGGSGCPDGPIHPEQLGSRATRRQEMQSEKKADECLQDSKCFCTLSWCTLASMPKVLSEALCLWCVLATLLACMVIVEFFGSSYTSGALFAGTAIGQLEASDQVAHFWRTRSRKMMVWALRVFYLTFSATIANTPWRERWIVASAACLSLVDVISRLLIAFCITFLQWPRLRIGTPVCQNSRFQATLLGASSWGRDEVSLWMLASFFSAGQVSVEGFAIATWAVMLSSLDGPSVFIMLLEVLDTSQRKDTQDSCKEIFGPGCCPQSVCYGIPAR